MRFSDLAAAGRGLAEELRPFRGREDVIVLALVRGGVPAAVEIARELDLPLDLVLRRTAVHAGAMHIAAAVNVAGTLVLDPEVQAVIDGPETPNRLNVVDLLALLAARVKACRGDREPASIAGKTILLVDN